MYSKRRYLIVSSAFWLLICVGFIFIGWKFVAPPSPLGLAGKLLVSAVLTLVFCFGVWRSVVAYLAIDQVATIEDTSGQASHWKMKKPRLIVWISTCFVLGIVAASCVRQVRIELASGGNETLLAISIFIATGIVFTACFAIVRWLLSFIRR
jgi:hypothetical protein